MNLIDEYWFWTMRAISEPEQSKNRHFYDKKLDKLFTLFIDNNQYYPILKNIIDENKNHEFKIEIEKIVQSSNDIISLPKLTMDERKNFFSDFITKVADDKIKKAIQNEVDKMSEKDKFDININLKNIDKTLYFKYDMLKGQFIVSKIIEHYTKYGISENSMVLW